MLFNVNHRLQLFHEIGDSFRVMSLIKKSNLNLKISVIVLLILCVTFSKTQNENTFSDPCSNSTTHRVEVQFSSKIVQNEYIVAFDDYYMQNTRKIYLTAAFSKVSLQSYIPTTLSKWFVHKCFVLLFTILIESFYYLVLMLIVRI